ncbi:MAG: hypothetical protein QM479_09365 [Pseudomonadota bacterium]
MKNLLNNSSTHASANSHTNNSKEWVFIFLLTFIGLFLFVKAGNWWVDILFDKNIKLLITKHKGDIIDLDMPKDIDFEETLYVNSINFPQADVLSHKQTGLIGYTLDFFMSLDSKFEVKQTQYFEFNIYSDDGFRLRIDNEVICEHIYNRPMQLSQCFKKLAQGTHHLQVDYYQGYGNLGLTAQYKLLNSDELYYIGENSDSIKFIPWL